MRTSPKGWLSMNTAIENRKPNRLAKEKSPYLLQHAHNPVDWFPWGDEAFEKAKAEDKPIFLSIGYSSCHWCHVMERESFEDEDTARILNEGFVSIKVDREERPDVDHLYMEACVAMTGQGGWPLNCFLDHDRRPFYAGTYFPKQARYGSPAFAQVLETLQALWRDDRQRLRQAGSAIAEHLSRRGQPGRPDPGSIDVAYSMLEQSFDHRHGGFGGAPKFPSAHNLLFLLRYGLLRRDSRAHAMVERTLDAMAAGGIFDHVGGGFCRYSTDGRWLVPHFEKMLYDNAMLLAAYAEATCAIDGRFADPARRIVQWLQREMALPGGAFATALDADSEGGEGATYLWTPQQVAQALGEADAERFCRLFDITGQGNFEGSNIPNHIGRELSTEETAFAERCFPKLLKERDRRPQPFKDDKTLASSNALMIMALCQAGRLLGEPGWVDMARKAADFLLRELAQGDRLMASHREGVTAHPASSDDYAYLLWALLELHQATLQPQWLLQAVQWADRMIALFWDETGGLFLAGNDVQGLFLRQKTAHDGALPCGNSVAAVNLLRLSRLTGRQDYDQRAQEILEALAPTLNAQPTALTMMLCALLHMENGGTELVIAQGKGMEAMLQAAQGYHPFTLVTARGQDYAELEEIAPVILPMDAKEGAATAYLCSKGACQQPMVDAAELAKRMAGVDGINVQQAEQDAGIDKL